MRPIDAAKAMRMIRDSKVQESGAFSKGINKGLNIALSVLGNNEVLPTIEATPVVHGRWIELPSMAPEYACSECGQSYEWWEVNEAHFCPNCGAKMDGEKDG